MSRAECRDPDFVDVVEAAELRIHAASAGVPSSIAGVVVRLDRRGSKANWFWFPNHPAIPGAGRRCDLVAHVQQHDPAAERH